MSLAHHLSPAAMLPELDVFSVPPTQMAIDRVIETVHRPFAQVETNKMLQFEFESAPDEFIRLNETELHLKVKINCIKDASLRTDLTKEKIKTEVSVINNLAHSLWNHVTMEINDKSITAMPTTYAYRAYLDTLFGFSDDSKKSWLTSVIWDEDKLEEEIEKGIKSTRMETFISGNDEDVKKGIGREVQLIMRPHLDLCMQERGLIGGLKIRLNFYPNLQKFFLKSKNDKLTPTFELVDAVLRVQRCKMTPLFAEAHYASRQKNTAKYFIRRAEVKEHNIQARTINAIIEHATSGQLPNVMIVGFVENEAYNGHLQKNPFNFKNANVTNIAAYINGIMHPSEEYKPNFDNELTLREYDDFFKTVNQSFTDATWPLDRKTYNKGYTFYAFNFNRDKAPMWNSNNYLNPIDKADVRLDIRFKNTENPALTCLIYCEYTNVIEIDPNNQVHTNYM